MKRGLEGWLAAGVGLAMYTVLVTLPGRVFSYDSLHLFRIYTAAGGMLLLSLGLATQQRWARWSALGAAWVVLLNLACWTHDHWPTRFRAERAWMGVGALLVLALLGSPFTRRRFEPEWTTPVHRSYRWAAIGVALCLTHAATAAVFGYMDRTTGPMVTALLMFAALLFLSFGKVVGLPMAVVALVAHGLSSTYEIPRVSAFGPENHAATWFFFVGRASHFTWAPALCAAVAATLYAAPHVARRIGTKPTRLALSLILGFAMVGGATAVNGQWRQYRKAQLDRLVNQRFDFGYYEAWSLDRLPQPPQLGPAKDLPMVDAAKVVRRAGGFECGMVGACRRWPANVDLAGRQRVVTGAPIPERLLGVVQLDGTRRHGWSETRVFHSDDGGASWWVIAELPGVIRDFAFLDARNALARLDQGWFRSANGGQDWAPSHNLGWEALEFRAAQEGRRLSAADLCPGADPTKLEVIERGEGGGQDTRHLAVAWNGKSAIVRGHLRDLGDVEEKISSRRAYEIIGNLLAAASQRTVEPSQGPEACGYTQLRWWCGEDEHQVSLARRELDGMGSLCCNNADQEQAPALNVRRMAEWILMDLLAPRDPIDWWHGR